MQHLINQTYMRTNRCSTLKEAAIDLSLGLLVDVSISLIHNRVRKRFRSTSFVLDELSTEQKQNGLDWCNKALFCLDDKPNYFSRLSFWISQILFLVRVLLHFQDSPHMIYQNDNCPIHKSRSTAKFFQTPQISVLEWLPQFIRFEFE